MSACAPRCSTRYARFGSTLPYRSRPFRVPLRASVCDRHPLPLIRPRPQAVRNAIHISHKPELMLPLVQNTTLPGESQQAAAARWRQVAVSP